MTAREKFVRNVITQTAREAWDVPPGHAQVEMGLAALGIQGDDGARFTFANAVTSQMIVHLLDEDHTHADELVEDDAPVTVKAELLRRTETLTVDEAVERLAGVAA